MTLRVQVDPQFYPWAIHRARKEIAAVARSFPSLPAWIKGSRAPTMKQLESFAAAMHVPIGFFFLPEPPIEPLPIADFRAVAGRVIESPSADLLDAIYLCQQRQDWYRDFAQGNGEKPKYPVGGTSRETPSATAAHVLSELLGFGAGLRRECATSEELQRRVIARCEELGVLIMVSGVVGNNTHRPLNPEEFRGFCLADAWAPLIFINGVDSKAAQLFTLVHELAHLLVGEEGVSNAPLLSTLHDPVESWCNAVAAEVLVPLAELRSKVNLSSSPLAQVDDLRRTFKVSALVILRRLFDAKMISRSTFVRAYSAENERLHDAQKRHESGGDFHNTEAVRVSRRFATALLTSMLEGTTFFRDAARLLGIRKVETMETFASRLGVLP
jgi:Zn-dependent peptidase ImmA (M78 family)